MEETCASLSEESLYSPLNVDNGNNTQESNVSAARRGNNSNDVLLDCSQFLFCEHGIQRLKQKDATAADIWHQP